MIEGFTSASQAGPTNLIKESVIEYYDWGLLSIGGFQNVNRPRSGVMGVSEHLLKPYYDPAYTDGKVWQTFRSNLVWQSGIGAITGTNLARPGISGVYVNNLFYSSSTSGNYGHYIDYPNGKVIFNSGLPTSSVVAMDYSYKWVNVCPVDNINWFKEVQASSMFPSAISNTQSGVYSIDPSTRIQLPAIGVEMSSRRKFRPYQLGGGQYMKTDILFHCVAEEDYTRNKLMDIISNQNDKIIDMINLDTVAASGQFPLDYRGTPISGALRHPDLLDRFAHSKKIEFSDTSLDSMYSLGPNLYVATVRTSAEVILDIT